MEVRSGENLPRVIYKVIFKSERKIATFLSLLCIGFQIALVFNFSTKAPNLSYLGGYIYLSNERVYRTSIFSVKFLGYVDKARGGGIKTRKEQKFV